MKKGLSFFLILAICFSCFLKNNSVVHAADLVVNTYEDACANIDQHVQFFSVEYHDKVTVSRMYHYNSFNKTWSNIFNPRMTDEECKNDVKSFISNSQPSDSQASGAFLAGLGVVSKDPVAILHGVMQALSISGGVSSDNIIVNSDGSVYYDDTALKAIKQQLEQQFLTQNGIIKKSSSGKPISFANNVERYLEYPEDISELYTDLDACDFMFGYVRHNVPVNHDAVAYSYNKSDYKYLYRYADGSIWGVDGDLKATEIPWKKQIADCPEGNKKEYLPGGFVIEHGEVVASGFKGVYSSTSGEFSMTLEKRAEDGYTFNSGVFNVSFYSKDNSPLYVFKSYEALYNYVHGSATAYMGSKFSESMDNLTLTLEQINQDWSAKMDAAFNTIGGAMGEMANARELQTMIDEAINKMLGVNEEIKDNTAETNKKLDDVIDLLKKQNDTLKKLLGVTSSIESSVDNIEAMTAMDLAVTMKNEYQKCAEKAKTKFPFSVPWDMYSLVAVLSAEPEPPHFDVNYGGVLGLPDTDAYKFTIDFKDAQPVSDVSRGFLSLTFISFLVTLTRKMFFNGGNIK